LNRIDIILKDSNINNQLYNFLANKGPDFKDRYISEILNFSDKDIEEKHDFIQWVFPTDEPSSIASDVPIVDDEVIDLFQKNEIAQTNLKNAKDLYLSFLFRNSHWGKKYDHNHLRITRVIKCLRLLLGDKEADDFKQKVYGILGGRILLIDEKARRYWSKA
tara:strand:- start:256 stop:741 length:486 start_codon:yes stop_codon:yes gene_type:complete